MKIRPALVLACALGGHGCSYDLDRLRGDARAADGGADAGVDISRPDIPAVMDAADVSTDLPADVPADLPTDLPADARPDVLSGPCTTHPFMNITSSTGMRFGETVVIAGTTTGGERLLTPPTFGAGCREPYTNAAPEQVFRYVVQTGPELVATTDQPRCANQLDTVLYALTACDPDAGRPLACDDDDDHLLCGGCTGDACPHTQSTIELDGLSPGDAVYLVVDGFAAFQGDFRLSIAENAAKPTTLPSTNPADRCSCPSVPTAREVVLTFPNGSETPDTGMPLNTPNVSRIHGERPVGLRTITGVTARFRLLANHLSGGGSCAGSVATIDLVVGTTVVASFQIASTMPAPGMVNVIYNNFVPVMLPSSPTPVTLEYRLRDVQPPGCGGIDIDWMSRGTNTLTLYGSG